MSEPTFFVHIVESPSPRDLLDGRTEGLMLASFLDLAHIPHTYNLAVDHEHFRVSLGERFEQVFHEIQLPPVIHLSSHGNKNGIQLTHQRTKGEIIEWKELAEILSGIRQMAGQFGLCMSTCGGRHARQMAKVIRPADVPFSWVAGSETTVSYCDAALAYAVFYRGLQKDQTQEALVESTRIATGLSDFSVELGEDIRKQFTRDVVNVLRKRMKGKSKH